MSSLSWMQVHVVTFFYPIFGDRVVSCLTYRFDRIFPITTSILDDWDSHKFVSLSLRASQSLNQMLLLRPYLLVLRTSDLAAP